MPSSRHVRNTRRATSPRLATSRVRIGSVTSPKGSHPEDAEAPPAFDRVGVDGGEADPQHVARVAGVDDAVVVEAGGEGEGQGFGFDLLLGGLSALWVRRPLG